MQKEKRNLLVFGYGLSLILIIVGVRIWAKQGLSGWVIFLSCSAALLFLATFFNYRWLKPVYAGWMAVARVIGEIISFVILALVYYLMFTLTAVLLRLFRKDFLGRDFLAQKDSYWLDTSVNDDDSNRFKNQF